MAEALFNHIDQITARALFISQRIDLRSLELTRRLGAAPLMLAEGSQGCAVIFRYGVVVLYNMSATEEMTFLNNIRPLLTDPVDSIESEEITLRRMEGRHEGIHLGTLQLSNFSIERLQLVADVLAKSIVLARYESSISSTFDRIEPLAENLKRHGTGGNRARELLRHIGDTLMIHAKMIGRAEVVDKPELLWEHPTLERLYVHLESEFELTERHEALERKLDLISRTAETLLGLLHTQRSLRVEWYIVLLIVFEILLTLYELFIAH